MSILVNKNSKVLVAGMTGREGSVANGDMKELILLVPSLA
jgi:succinyl-CoA synthetase alpha subunit